MKNYPKSLLLQSIQVDLLFKGLLITLGLNLTGCIRSELNQSAYQDCLDGERIVSNAYVFCVFQRQVSNYTEHDQGLNASDMTSEENLHSECPSFTPYAHEYLELTVCSETESLETSLLESVVRQWSAQYSALSPPPSDQLDQGLEDQDPQDQELEDQNSNQLVPIDPEILDQEPPLMLFDL